jgi:hypothetical protein
LKTAPSITSALRAEGYFPGNPSFIAPALVRVDAQRARAMSCSCCGYRGLTLEPFTKGNAHYTAVGRCDRCKNEVEL